MSLRYWYHIFLVMAALGNQGFKVPGSRGSADWRLNHYLLTIVEGATTLPVWACLHH
jgi:hypothetical protein